MLQKLRDKTSGWIATAILGLLMIPFLFVVDNSYLGGVGANNVAKVQAPPSWWKSAPSWWPLSLLWKHHEIGTQEFRTRFEQLRMQERQQQGDAFDTRQFETKENKLRTLDQLIDEQVVRLSAENAGIVVGDDAVRNYIASIPAFQVDGKFNAEQYRMTLAQGMPPRTPEQFDAVVRDSLQQSLVAGALVESAFTPKSEFERVLKLLGETRDVDLALLPEPAADTAPVDAAQISQWYNEHPADFRQPEQVSIEYVELNAASLPPPKGADETTLRKRYEEEKARFVDPDQRLASHILITAGSDPAAQKAAEEKAAKLAAEARQPNADFAALARANSQDTGSKEVGGDLGWVERGMMVKPFEDALFAGKVGEVIGPVKSEFGYHVIKLREVKGGNGKPFEQVRDQLAAEQLKSDSDKAYSELSGKLVDLVYKNPTALEPAAKEVGLQVQKLGPFSRGDAKGVAEYPAVQRAAFSDTLVQDGTVSDLIQLQPNHALMLRVTAHTPEKTLPLDQVRDKVIAAVRADRAQLASSKAADALLERLRKGESMHALAAAEKLQLSPIPGLPRTAPVPTVAANHAIFSAPAPTEGKPSVGKVELSDGRYALFALNKITPIAARAAQSAGRQCGGARLCQRDAQAIQGYDRRDSAVTPSASRRSAGIADLLLCTTAY
jgi:peptidyl-prolyl cis-trans isomerase D